MAETFKFVYVLILFISICFVITVSVSGSLNLRNHACIKDKDCPMVKNILILGVVKVFVYISAEWFLVLAKSLNNVSYVSIFHELSFSFSACIE